MKRFKPVSFLLALCLISNVESAATDKTTIDGIDYTIYYIGSDHLNYAAVTGASCSGAVTIPDTIKHSDYYDGNYSQNKPFAVREIGDYAFSNKTNITSVTISKNVSSIGYNAFYGCSGLNSIVVDDSNKTYDSRYNCNAIIKKSSKELVVGCNNTIIPSDITSIGNYAFYNCIGLSSIVIPKSLTKIGSQAFRGCTGLSSIIVESENTIYDSRDNCNAIISTSDNNLILGCENTAIPNTVTSISSYAFYGCDELTGITIPQSITSLTPSSFYCCKNLVSITVESGNSKYDSRDNCNAIIETSSNSLIFGCKNTTIPSTVTSIGQFAFQYCLGLESISIPNSVTNIDEYAFLHCSGLLDFDLGNSINSISRGMFYGCSELTKVIIPENITSIGAEAFQKCTKLLSVVIPSSVTSIGSYAFSNCDNLTSVTVLNENPVTIYDSYTFSNRKNAILYVPTGSKAAYEAADYWKEFKEIIEMEDDSDTDISQLEDVIYTEPTSGLAGTTIGLCVKMKNMLTPVGCSFKLTLPEGVRLQTDGDGDVVYELGSRAKKMSVTMQDWGDGSYDFALTPSSATATITGNDDTFITFHVQLPDDMEAGDYKLKLTRCLIQSKTDGTTKDYALSDVTTTLTVEDYMMGDVNGDRTITPSDAIMTLYHYFSVEQTGFNAKAADVNGDGTVTPADAIEMLYMYFGAGSNAARQNKQTHEPQ